MVRQADMVKLDGPAGPICTAVQSEEALALVTVSKPTSDLGD